MNRRFKRLLALGGSLALGVVGAVALGSPAQAHHNTIRASFACAGQQGYAVSWSIQNSEGDKTETLTAVTATPNTPILQDIAGNPAIAAGTTLGKSATITGKQTVPLSTTWVKLDVSAKWSNNFTNSNTSGKITVPKLDCSSYTGKVSGGAECDRETGTWKVTWTVTNENANSSAKVDVITGSGSNRTGTHDGSGWTTLANENDIVGVKDGDTVAAGSSKTATQTVAGNKDGARLKVQFKWTPQNWETKTNDQYSEIWFQGPCVKNAPKPGVTFASDCTGVVTVTLINAADATKDAKFEITGTGGWTSGVKTVAPGETEAVIVPKENAGGISVLEAGVQLKSYSWTDSTSCHPIKIEVTSTCLSLEFTLTNPENGAAALVKLTPSAGDVWSKTIAPGTTETASFTVGAGSLSVEQDVNGDKDTVNWVKPNDCGPLNFEVRHNCDGLTFVFTNPQDGKKADIKLETVTPETAAPVQAMLLSSDQTFSLNPGDSKTVSFPGDAAGLTVHGTVNGKPLGGQTGKFTWVKPDNCQLPKTGDNVTLYTASGIGLVIVGVGVFLLARRRLVRLRRMA